MALAACGAPDGGSAQRSKTAPAERNGNAATTAETQRWLEHGRVIKAPVLSSWPAEAREITKPTEKVPGDFGLACRGQTHGADGSVTILGLIGRPGHTSSGAEQKTERP
jgi:hypothetical protein